MGDGKSVDLLEEVILMLERENAQLRETLEKQSRSSKCKCAPCGCVASIEK